MERKRLEHLISKVLKRFSMGVFVYCAIRPLGLWEQSILTFALDFYILQVISKIRLWGGRCFMSVLTGVCLYRQKSGFLSIPFLFNPGESNEGQDLIDNVKISYKK